MEKSKIVFCDKHHQFITGASIAFVMLMISMPEIGQNIKAFIFG